MHWQDAVEQSNMGRAYRTEGQVRYYRFRDGFTLRENGPHIREATCREREGHLDWEPAVPMFTKETIKDMAAFVIEHEKEKT